MPPNYSVSKPPNRVGPNKRNPKMSQTIQINKSFCENKTVVREQVFNVLCDDDIHPLLSAQKWAYVQGYAINKSHPNKNKSMHVIIMTPPAGCVVHHINGNKLDNRQSNLQIVTHSEHRKIHGALGGRPRKTPAVPSE